MKKFLQIVFSSLFLILIFDGTYFLISMMVWACSRASKSPIGEIFRNINDFTAELGISGLLTITGLIISSLYGYIIVPIFAVMSSLRISAAEKPAYLEAFKKHRLWLYRHLLIVIFLSIYTNIYPFEL